MLKSSKQKKDAGKDSSQQIDLDSLLEAAGLVGSQKQQDQSDSALAQEAARPVRDDLDYDSPQKPRVQVDDEEAAQTITDATIGDVEGYTSEEEILIDLASSCGMEYVRLRDYDFDPLLINTLPASIARSYNVFPVSKENGVLTVAMLNPLNVQALDDLSMLLNIEVKGAVAHDEEIIQLVEEYYGSQDEDVNAVLEDLETQGLDLTIDEEDFGDLERVASQPPIIKLVNLLLLQAIQEGASDLHIEPFESSFRIRYRVDGLLHETIPPPKQLQTAVISRIKVMASMNIAERRVPQDGRIQLNISQREIDLRVSSLPTVNGESIVMRILDRNMMKVQLHDIGLEEYAYETFCQSIARPNGIVLVTGPTGSGKTTTLYASLQKIYNPTSKMITAENPVEYHFKGITQVDIRPEVGLTFQATLRSMLRQDPDIIMVGEIRDVETAKIAVEAALTGHLVLSTLHTNDAPSAITRLVDMGVEPFLITSSVEAVLAQRLVRVICTSCKDVYYPSQDEIDEFQIDQETLDQVTFYSGVGCEACNFSRYKGRLGIFEIFQLNEDLREMVLARCSSTELYNIARSQGMVTLREDGWRKIVRGKTTLEEVLRETNL